MIMRNQTFKCRAPARRLALRVFKQQGSALLESMIAILIFSIGVIGIIALQASMVKATAQAKYRADANFIAQEMLGKMWADPVNMANYFNYSCGSTLPAGNCAAASVPGGAAGEILITITWQPPGDVQHTFVMPAMISGYTP